jgi:6-phosphofructokinase 1
MTDHMVAFERSEKDGKYHCEMKMVNLSNAANAEKTVPMEWINDEGNFVKEQFIDYALPLIQGDSHPPYVEGLPRFANLKKIQAGKNR